MTSAVEMTGVRRHFGQVRAVDGVDIDIAPGEVVALLGPNGAGKSTTIDMLLGLTRPDAGQVRIFGMPPEKATAAGVVGAMLQTGSLIRRQGHHPEAQRQNRARRHSRGLRERRLR